MKTKLKLHLLLLTLLSLSGLAHAQGTAIGYQGRLNEGGVPATGLYDFTFNVFNVEAGGAPLAAPVVLAAVPVTNGLFNVSLDFTPNVFTGPARWLETTVRPGGVGLAKVLTPRVRLLPTPYAIYAGTAGYVAEGVVTMDHLNTGGVRPTPGQFLSYNGGNLYWSDPGVAAGDIFSRGVNGADAYYNAGNVGIGTSTPAHRLSLAGGPAWTANGWIGAIALPNASAIGWGANAGGQRFGMGHSSGGFYLFRTQSNPGTIGSPALYDFVVNDGGYVGIGTTTPSFKLDVLSDTSTAIVGRSTVISGVGVYGESAQFNGVRGVANNVNHGAVVGVHNSGGVGVLGQSTGHGVFGNSLGGGAGVYGESAQFNGVRGVANNVNHGAVVGLHNSGGLGVLGVSSGTGVQGESSSAGGYGGYFRNTAGGTALGVEGTARVSVLQITGGADLAEPFKISHAHIGKGSVVVIDEEHPGQLKLSDKAYDQRVAGIVSGANGVNPGISLQQEGVLEGGQNVSLSGRVYVQVDAANGSIKPGDLLTTSGTPGHAMKATDHTRSQGAILGKAMSGLKEGKGMVLVLVTLQ